MSSVFLISLISLVGILFLSMRKDRLEKILLYLVSFAVGALFGDVFIHIIPHISAGHGFTYKIGTYFILGILLFFIIERFVNWHHCHKVEHEHKIKPLAYTNLIGDGFHNFLDGIIIASSFMVSVPVGIATTLAVIFHEIPQEISDFAVLLYAGFSKKKAFLLNFLSAVMAILGAVLTLLFLETFQGLEVMLLAFAGGGFIYIAGSDLIPELHKEQFSNKKSILQLLSMLLGIAIMFGLIFFE